MTAFPKGRLVFLVVLLLICIMLFVSCGAASGISTATQRPTSGPPPTPNVCASSASSTSSLIVIGQPSFVKLPDGYQLKVLITNCSAVAIHGISVVGAWKTDTGVSATILTAESGSTTLPGNSQETYQKAGITDLGVTPLPKSMVVIIDVNSNNEAPAEWKGSIPIPS